LGEITRSAIVYEVTIRFCFFSVTFHPSPPNSLLPRLYALGLGCGTPGHWWLDPAPTTLHPFFASTGVPLSLLRELRPPSHASLQALAAHLLSWSSLPLRVAWAPPPNKYASTPPQSSLTVGPRALFPSNRARWCLPTPPRYPTLEPLFPFGAGFNKEAAFRGRGLAIAGNPTTGGEIC
jgi:hypothetical protein